MQKRHCIYPCFIFKVHKAEELSQIRQLPVNFRLASVTQGRVDLREWLATKKTIARGERRGVCGLDNRVPRGVNQADLLLRIAAPEYKDDGIALLIDCTNNSISKLLPAMTFMRVRLMSTDR